MLSVRCSSSSGPLPRSQQQDPAARTPLQLCQPGPRAPAAPAPTGLGQRVGRVVVLLEEVEDRPGHLERVGTLALANGLGAAPDADLREETVPGSGAAWALPWVQGAHAQLTSTCPELLDTEVNWLTMKASR